MGALLAIGSYGDDDGLVTGWWDDAGGFSRAAAAGPAAPSFACWHPSLPLLYAVSEQPDGAVVAHATGDDGALTPAGRIDSGGAEPCWIACDPIGRALLVANYDVERGHASMTIIALGDDGHFTGDATVVRRAGSGPVPGRQEASHIHQVVPTPHGTVLASDLGADRLIEYEITAGGFTEVTRVPLPAGTGPRHIALASDGQVGFVTGELNATVTVIRREAGAWRAAHSVRCTATTDVPTDRVYPSHVALAGLDRWLLVANRGPATLAVLDVAGGLRVVSEVAVTAWPRHFALAGETVLVAGQHGNTVQALSLDPATGALTDRGEVCTLPGASCVAVRGQSK